MRERPLDQAAWGLEAKKREEWKIILEESMGFVHWLEAGVIHGGHVLRVEPTKSHLP